MLSVSVGVILAHWETSLRLKCVCVVISVIYLQINEVNKANANDYCNYVMGIWGIFTLFFSMLGKLLQLNVKNNRTTKKGKISIIY